MGHGPAVHEHLMAISGSWSERDDEERQKRAWVMRRVDTTASTAARPELLAHETDEAGLLLPMQRIGNLLGMGLADMMAQEAEAVPLVPEWAQAAGGGSEQVEEGQGARGGGAAGSSTGADAALQQLAALHLATEPPAGAPTQAQSSGVTTRRKAAPAAAPALPFPGPNVCPQSQAVQAAGGSSSGQQGKGQQGNLPQRRQRQPQYQSQACEACLAAASSDADK